MRLWYLNLCVFTCMIDFCLLVVVRLAVPIPEIWICLNWCLNYADPSQKKFWSWDFDSISLLLQDWLDKHYQPFRYSNITHLRRTHVTNRYQFQSLSFKFEYAILKLPFVNCDYYWHRYEICCEANAASKRNWYQCFLLIPAYSAVLCWFTFWLWRISILYQTFNLWIFDHSEI